MHPFRSYDRQPLLGGRKSVGLKDTPPRPVVARLRELASGVAKPRPRRSMCATRLACLCEVPESAIETGEALDPSSRLEIEIIEDFLWIESSAGDDPLCLRGPPRRYDFQGSASLRDANVFATPERADVAPAGRSA